MYRLQSRPLWQRAKSGPAFAIDFIHSPAIPAGWSFNRSSPATYFDANCVMQTAGNDVARFDHDPASAAALGLRLESGRANYLIRSNAPELWTLQTASVNTDATLSLDGKTPARKLIASASTATPHSASQTYSTNVSAATVFSYYVRLKPRELTYALIELSDSTSANFCGAAFDLISGDVIGPVTYGSAWKLSSSSCIPLADGWKQVMI
jgi:hypothetical protein